MKRRDIAICIILWLVTCVFYGIYWMIVLNDETNALRADRAKRRYGFFAQFDHLRHLRAGLAVSDGERWSSCTNSMVSQGAVRRFCICFWACSGSVSSAMRCCKMN